MYLDSVLFRLLGSLAVSIRFTVFTEDLVRIINITGYCLSEKNIMFSETVYQCALFTCPEVIQLELYFLKFIFNLFL